MSLALIDSTCDSVTFSWPETPGAVRYVLQYRNGSSSDDTDINYQTLSEKLTTTQARKKNLEDNNGKGFFFRVRAVRKNDGDEAAFSWKTHTEPFHLLSEAEESSRMGPPKVVASGFHAAVVSWNAAASTTPSNTGYELQMRENGGGVPWKTIAPSLAGTEVRKKNLTSKNGYQFRVRPVVAATSVPVSPPSDVFVSAGLSEGMKNLFRSLENGTLLRKVNEDPISVEDALAGKEFVLLYASAHWCPPCRKFTPMLLQWYQQQSRSSIVEVVFLSADHDERSFRGYYGEMPWLAVDYDDDAREQLMNHIRVTGIPRLVVLDGNTGRILEDNAVGKPLDLNRWRSLASS